MEPPVQQAPMSMIRWAMLIGLLLLFFTLAASIWTINQSPNQPNQGLNIFARTDRSEYHPWPPLEEEKKLYIQDGYDVSWMENKAMLSGRELIGPYAALVELIALRLYGLSKIIPLVLLAFWIGFAEGRVQAGEKTTTFGNISATRFKWAMVAVCFCIALSILFITLPFGTDLPFVGTLPLVWNAIWLTSPHYWGVIFSFLVGITMYNVFSNLSIEV